LTSSLRTFAARPGVRVLAAGAVFAAGGCTALLGLEDLSGPDGGDASDGSGGITTSGGAVGGDGGRGDASATSSGQGGSGGNAPCGGGLTVLATDQGLPGRIAVGDEHAYWIVEGDGSTRLVQVDKDGSGEAVDVDGYDDGLRSDAVAALGSYVCWAKHRTPVEVVCRIGDAFMPAQLGADIEEVVDMTIGQARVFVTTIPTGVYSIELSVDMTVNAVDLPTDASAIFSGIDGTPGRVCVAQQMPPAIRCFSPATGNEEMPAVVDFPPSSTPANVALAPAHVYLTNPAEEAIYATSFPGAEISVIAGAQISLGDIGFDTTSLYWTANPRRGAGRVLRWQVGARADTQQTVLEGLLDPFGIALDADAVYVTDRLGGSVYRCTKPSP
jgi:hypothetical protein